MAGSPLPHNSNVIIVYCIYRRMSMTVFYVEVPKVVWEWKKVEDCTEDTIAHMYPEARKILTQYEHGILQEPIDEG